jgi:trehalose 6-phosphate synthase/phosphatase
MQDERNEVYVMSGRSPDELDSMLKRVPNLGLIAENGAYLKEFGSTQWTALADAEQMNTWKESVSDILNYFRERTPGSWVEERHCSLIFHYKNADDLEAATRLAGDCASHINDACEDQHVRAVPTEGAVIVESTDWTKGTAAQAIADRMKARMEPDAQHKLPVDFLLVFGDGREDEVVFKWANELGENDQVRRVTTVSLGSRNTDATKTIAQGVTGKLYLCRLSISDYRANMTIGVLTVLQRLAALS